MSKNELYLEYCLKNNISMQESILYRKHIESTLNYQCFIVGKEIDNIFKQLIKELSQCAKYAKDKGIIK